MEIEKYEKIAMDALHELQRRAENYTEADARCAELAGKIIGFMGEQKKHIRAFANLAKTYQETALSLRQSSAEG
jgi:hypothetical protein